MRIDARRSRIAAGSGLRLFILTSVFLAMGASAAEKEGVKISSLGVDAINKIAIIFADEATPLTADVTTCTYCNGTTTCPAGYIDISTAEGRTLFSAAEAAFLAGKQSKVFAMSCGAYGLPQIGRIDVHR